MDSSSFLSKYGVCVFVNENISNTNNKTKNKEIKVVYLSFRVMCIPLIKPSGSVRNKDVGNTLFLSLLFYSSSLSGTDCSSEWQCDVSIKSVR